MLDLKAKLLAAGLVTEEQVEKVEREEDEKRRKRREQREQREQRKTHGKRPPKGPGKGKKGPPAAADERADQERWQKRLAALKEGGKSEQYDAIRTWVQRTRIDAVKAIPTEAAERFHFARHDEGIASLTLEPEVRAKLLDGSAGICVFMSNNGLTHCVVPRDVALDIGAVRPEWVRVLDGFDIVPNRDELRAKEYAEARGGEAGADVEAQADRAAQAGGEAQADGEAQAQAGSDDEAQAAAEPSPPQE